MGTELLCNRRGLRKEGTIKVLVWGLSKGLMAETWQVGHELVSLAAPSRCPGPSLSSSPLFIRLADVAIPFYSY